MNNVESETLNAAKITRIIALLASKSKRMLMDESLLPAKKPIVKKALWAGVLTAKSQEEKKAYKWAYLLLCSFLPDVGPNGVNLSENNLHEWEELSKKMNSEMKALKEELELLEGIEQRKLGAHHSGPRAEKHRKEADPEGDIINPITTGISNRASSILWATYTSPYTRRSYSLLSIPRV
jgi:hypothetical protein